MRSLRGSGGGNEGGKNTEEKLCDQTGAFNV
jgi:hypothetical protein